MNVQVIGVWFTKEVKHFIRRGWPNTFGNIVYIYILWNINMAPVFYSIANEKQLIEVMQIYKL